MIFLVELGVDFIQNFHLFQIKNLNRVFPLIRADKQFPILIVQTIPRDLISEKRVHRFLFPYIPDKNHPVPASTHKQIMIIIQEFQREDPVAVPMVE